MIPPGIVSESSVHFLELSDVDPSTAELEIDGQQLKALRSPGNRVAKWEWSVGFHAGSVDIGIIVEGKASRAEVILDPDLRKLSRWSFERMVFEVFEDLAAVFALSPARVGFDKGNNRPPLARLEFLHSRLDKLIQAVRRIIERPHRHLEAVDKIVPIQRAARISAADLQRSMRYGPHLKTGNRRLPAALRDALPSRVALRQRRATTDNAENRAVKAFLVRWAAWLERAGASLRASRDKGIVQVWARRCVTMASRLKHLLADPFFSEIQDGSEADSSGSSVFRVVPGYQEFARIRRDMGFGLAAVAGEWLEMPLARTHDLYELWVFLRLLRAGLSLTGAQAVVLDGVSEEKDGSVVLPRNAFGVSAGKGMRIVFQRSYREYWTMDNQDGSFTRELIPDVALSISGENGESRLIVLDAKYRVESALNEALSSIHTYRDGLVHEDGAGDVSAIVQGAYLVSPFVPKGLDGNWKSTSMPNRLFHPVYQKRFRFGAITMAPGVTSIDEAAELLVRILEDCDVQLKQPHGGENQS